MKACKLILCTLTAIAVLGTACSSDDLIGDENSNKGIIINATATTPIKKLDTRLTHTDQISKMDIVWTASDAFTAYVSSTNKQDYTLQSGEGSGTASFTANSWNVEPTGTLYALYPANVTADPTAVSLSVDGQNGKLEDLKKFNYMTASTVYQSGEDLNFSFTHQVAIVKLVLTFPDGVTGDANKVGLHAMGLNKDVQLNLTDGTCSNVVVGDVTTGANTITINEKKLTVYLCVFPGNLTNVKAIAKVGTDNYEADLSNFKIEAGHMYTAQVAMKKSIIGYYYYDNGDCLSTYTTVGKTCIGIVFWESEDGTQGKIASLVDSPRLEWAVENSAPEKEWGFNDKKNGVAATKTVIGDQISNDDFEYNYPLFYWIYNTKNGSDINSRWYIPAIDELEQLLKSATENEIFKSSLAIAGGDALRIVTDSKPAWYWTCTEGRPGGVGELAINVAQIASNTIQIGFVSKTGGTCVRPIAVITISK